MTVYDIAKLANVSASTVSRAINNPDVVSKKTRDKIFKVIDKYNFKINTVAQSLSLNKTNTISIICPDIINMYYASIVSEIEQLAQKKGYTVLLANSDSDLKTESTLLNMFVSRRVDGIIFMGGRIDEMNIEKKYITELEKISKDIPIVLSSRVSSTSIPQLYYDIEKPIDELIVYLKSIGCKSIGVLGGRKNVYVSYKRYRAFQKLCEKHNIDFVENDYTFEANYDIPSGYKAMVNLINNCVVPDVICCTNDPVAVGALKACYDNNIFVPHKVMITAIDGTPMCDNTIPTLTSLNYNLKDFAKSLLDKLLSLIDENETSSKFEENVTLKIGQTTK